MLPLRRGGFGDWEDGSVGIAAAKHEDLSLIPSIKTNQYGSTSAGNPNTREAEVRFLEPDGQPV